MSFYNIGSSPMELDATVKNNTGGVLYRGDIVQIEAETIANLDGANAVMPVLDSSSPETLMMPCGVVLGTERKLSFVDQEEVRVRLLGVVDALVDGGTDDVVIQDHLYLVDAQYYLQAKDAEPDLVTAPVLQDLNVTASAEAGNTSTTIDYHDQTVSIDASTLAAGDLIDVWATGYIADSNSTDTALITAQFNDVSVGVSTAIDVADGDMWSYRYTVAVTAIGASGAVEITGAGHGPDALAAAVTPWVIQASNAAAAATTDTTGAVRIRTGVTFSVSHADNGSIQTSIGYRVIRGAAVVDLVDMKACKAIAIEANTAAAPATASRTGASTQLFSVFFNGLPQI